MPLSGPSRGARPILVATRRAQPTVVFIVRLTLTAVAAYDVAWALPLADRPLLAPLTALLVVQYTLYQTVRSALRRILAVVTGVLVAVLLSSALGFNWLTLGAAIGVSLVIGYAVRLGEHFLEVPISAMLIFALGAHTATGALTRIAETLVGAGVGLLAGLIASPVHLTPAREAIAELGGRMGELVDRLADALSRAGDDGAPHDHGNRDGHSARHGHGDRDGQGDRDGKTFTRLLDRSRELGREIARTDGALSQAEESLRLNLRAAPLHPTGLALRSGLSTLEFAALNVRGAPASRSRAEPPSKASAEAGEAA